MENAVSFFNKGEENFNSSEWELAIENFGKAIQRDPSYAEAHKRRGDTYAMLGILYSGGIPNNATKAAYEDYSEAIRLDPNLASAYQGRGDLLHNLGSDTGQMDKVRTAIEEYSKAIQLDPQNADNYAYRAISYGIIGRLDDAEADEAKACELDRSRCP